jgi:hypothetical protein
MQHDPRPSSTAGNETGRAVADVLLLSAGIAAVYLIATKPRVRRVARIALRAWLGMSVPAFLLTTARRAWIESARAA